MESANVKQMDDASLDEIVARFWSTDDGLTAIQRAEAYGIDVSLIEESLRLSLEERLNRNQEALALIDSLQYARKHHGKP